MKVMTPKVSPSIYIRYNLPEVYLKQFKEICPNIVVEPWNFDEPEPEVTADLSECEILLTLGMRDNLNILKKAKNVKWVHSISAGLDAMLTDVVKNSDVIITNAKGCTSVPIAEHTIALISAFSRDIPTMVKKQRAQEWCKMLPVRTLAGSTVGIIGYGEIGYEIAKRCKGLEMKVIGCRRNPDKKNKKHEPADVVVGMDQVDEVLAKSDYVVVALPSTKDTIHFMNKERFSKMKKDSYLINVGRGNTVAEKDLVDCLRNGKIAGAGLDVFEVEPLPKDHPFWYMDNVIVSPHNAYNSSNHSERVMKLILENLTRFYEGIPLLNVVDKKLGY
ncbi:phosphoglycerate dehydrogenase-like enzyme [Neobacillus bataviensis]|uniref:Phosphoglycerate dehydrogenase-like enzyme n=1 Tax=Neobacillus bataviensis TaxID=220685 RepID=A0A561DEM6_9BACI|nr:D-2-hydroxyacid dehydrogenase [Neobacillus bataviensis]TWE01844.1 phosphoglycerate dehydrogenase-like enzyme [Neobacillus bataviensis]